MDTQLKKEITLAYFPEKKNILQFWFGDIPSIYCLLQNLLHGNSVTLICADTAVNKEQLEEQEKLTALLQKDIDIFCRHNADCVEPNFSHQIKNVFFNLQIGRDYDELQIPKVFENKIMVKAFSKSFDRDCIEVSLPINNLDIEIAEIALQFYDDLIGTSFIQHTASNKQE